MDDYEGLRDFVVTRGAALSRAAYLLTSDRNSAAELVQATLVKAAGRWRRIVTAGNPEAYVRRMLINEHISWWRRLGRREVSTPRVPDRISADSAEATVQRIDLADALHRLPKRQRTVIVLRFYLDLSEADTATVGCSVGTVKGHARRQANRMFHA